MNKLTETLAPRSKEIVDAIVEAIGSHITSAVLEKLHAATPLSRTDWSALRKSSDDVAAQMSALNDLTMTMTKRLGASGLIGRGLVPMSGGVGVFGQDKKGTKQL